LQLNQKFFKNNHSELALLYNNLGLIWSYKGEYSRAMEYIDVSRILYKSLHGEYHPSVAISYINLGFIYFNINKYKNAAGYAQLAIDMLNNHTSEYIISEYVNKGQDIWRQSLKLLKPPSSYAVGEEFFQDEQTVDVVMNFSLLSPSKYESFQFRKNGSTVGVMQEENILVVNIQKVISSKLFHELNQWNNNLFIIGYIEELLDDINKHLSEQKYKYGQLLGKIYYSFDICNLIVINLSSFEETTLNWPKAVAGFPGNQRLTVIPDSIYIRDFMDSISSLLIHNIDEGVRKAITSLEIFFKKFNIRGKTFAEKLDKALDAKYYTSTWHPYLPILKHNILIFYKVRNKITHDELRLNFEYNKVYRKIIGTFSYVYQSRLNDPNTIRYIYYLTLQFLSVEMIVKGMNLNELANSYNTVPSPSNIINTFAAFEDAMFTGLKVTAEEETWLYKSDTTNPTW